MYRYRKGVKMWSAVHKATRMFPVADKTAADKMEVSDWIFRMSSFLHLVSSMDTTVLPVSCWTVQQKNPRGSFHGETRVIAAGHCMRLCQWAPVQEWGMSADIEQPHFTACNCVKYVCLWPWCQISLLCLGHRMEQRLCIYLSNLGDPTVDVESVRQELIFWSWSLYLSRCNKKFGLHTWIYQSFVKHFLVCLVFFWLVCWCLYLTEQHCRCTCRSDEMTFKEIKVELLLLCTIVWKWKRPRG